MNLKTAKQIRKAVGQALRPAQYEKIELHHIAHSPVFEKHTRVIRTMGPVIPGEKPNERARPFFRGGGHYDEYRSGTRCRVVTREVQKIIMQKDGKTPRSPVWQEHKDEKTGEVSHIPQTELIPIAKPIRLKKGSPRAIYRMLKKLERTVGLDLVFKQLEAEAGVAA